MPRIISGLARGRRLAVPPGTKVRPTTDRVREALFNVIAHRVGFEIDGCRALDLFAGAGTLGLEALSRGADDAVFVEADSGVVKVLTQNLSVIQGGTIVRRKVAAYLAKPTQLFDLVFLDPPYNRGHVGPTLEALAPWLAPDAIVCVDRDPDERIEATALSLIFERRYGASTISILAREHPAPDQSPVSTEHP